MQYNYFGYQLKMYEKSILFDKTTFKILKYNYLK